MSQPDRIALLGLLAAGFVAAAWSETPCRRNPVLEAWLADQAPRWREQLLPLAGFEDPGPVEVCAARSGGPRADYSSNRIWLRHLDYREDRRSLAHEYLHLAFRRSPRTRDEAFIETTARRVLGEEP
jgi:uncharacterized protein YfaQ (DUF2300 family)